MSSPSCLDKELSSLYMLDQWQMCSQLKRQWGKKEQEGQPRQLWQQQGGWQAIVALVSEGCRMLCGGWTRREAHQEQGDDGPHQRCISLHGVKRRTGEDAAVCSRAAGRGALGREECARGWHALGDKLDMYIDNYDAQGNNNCPLLVLTPVVESRLVFCRGMGVATPLPVAAAASNWDFRWNWVTITTLTKIQPRPPDTTITRNNQIKQRREEEKGQVEAAAALAKRGGVYNDDDDSIPRQQWGPQQQANTVVGG